MTMNENGVRKEPHPKEPDPDERAVTSEPIDTEDGGTVVVQQQNVGPANQLGGGEFKNVRRGRTP